jgi:hypothetical protein
VSLGRPPGPGRQQAGAQVEPPKTVSARGFKGLNLTDTRLNIDDDELAWQENALVLGRAVSAVPLYRGDPGKPLSSSLVKESFGCSLTYGENTSPHPVEILVFEDGSAWMRDRYLDGAVDRQIAGPGTFSASPLATAIAMWQDGPVLFQDEGVGYLSYNGSTLTLINGTKKGRALAVFEGHVWLKTGPRAFDWTAPNTYNDFTPANGAGTEKITDEAFEGEIEGFHSTVEQLWVFSATSIDAIGNVATNLGITTFATTNAVGTLGTKFRGSIGSYFRALVFFTGYSLHALLGVTPQKLSAKLDRLLHHLSPAVEAGPRVGVQKLQGKEVLVFLFQFQDARTQTVRSLLVCLDEGRAFLAGTPDLADGRVVDLLTLVVNGSPEVYGVDTNGRSYRIFARPGDAGQGTMTVSTKLFDMGTPLQGSQFYRVGVDLSADPPDVAAGGSVTLIPLTVTLVSERRAVVQPDQFVRFAPLVDAPLDHRFALYRTNADMAGQRIGVSVALPAKYPVTIEAIHFEAAASGEWEPTQPAIRRALFYNNSQIRAHFVNHAGDPVFWVN